MSLSIRSAATTAAFVLAFAAPAAAQQPTGLVGDLLTDLSQVEKKMVGLARAIPADKYSWRPGQGVRSVGEVLLHLSSDNYLIPAALGVPADPSTGIKGTDYKTAQAFEQRKLGKDAIVSEVEKSFAHMKKALGATQPAKLGDKVTLFGQPFTVQGTWVLAVTHAHEHLGQMIAYARSNGVVPPWSQ